MCSSVKIIINGAVSIVIQFGLAIAGWGGWSAFFAHPALRALAWVAAGLALLAVFSGAGMSSGEKEDRANRWVLGAFGAIALLMPYFSAYTDRIGFWTLGGNTLRWVGVALCAAGGVLRILPAYVLEQLSLTVSSGPLAATTLYRSLGFETFGYERGAIKIAQQYFDEEYMVLRLR
jgi:hypothetical protein